MARRKPAPLPCADHATPSASPPAEQPGRRATLVRRAGGATRGPSGQAELTPAGLEQIERDAAAGLANASIASRMGVDRHTFLALRKRDPRVEEALERGRAKLEDEIVHLLLEQGRAGNTTALIWLSKNRLGWRDSPAVEAGQVNVQVIQLPAALSEAEYRRAFDAPALPPADAEVVDGD